jgi:truncated hemoglobin YjbI
MSERRTQVTIEIVERTGINENMIERLVHAFYDRVRKDPLVGPVFDRQVANWDMHLERMCAFWSSVALMTGRYHGQPMEKHLPLSVDSRHFDRWLQLFRETACSSQELEEERRLLYVAMTRAKDHLHLMVPQRFFVQQQRTSGDRHVYAQRTRFIPSAILSKFDNCHWPSQRTQADMRNAALRQPIDLKAKLRGMWS